MSVDIFSTAISFLVGAAAGGVSGYFASKYTDRRRESETDRNEKKRFLKTKKKMPAFIKELKADLAEYPDIREFFVLKKGVCLGGSKLPRFRYEYERDGKDNLRNKMQILENMGYIMDVTPGNTPIFRITEDFFDLIKKYG